MVNKNGALSVKEILSYTITSEACLRCSEYEDHIDGFSHAHDGTRKEDVPAGEAERLFSFIFR